MTETSKLTVTSADGVVNTLFATAPGVVTADAPIILIKPALGVRASFYAAFFDALAPHGIRAATVDWRGHGRSSERPSRQVDFGYRELLELDLPAELAALREAFPDAPIILLGHSLGGQLSFLHAAASPGSVAGVLAVACCSVYWRTYGKRPSPGVWLFTRFARWSSALLGVFPGEKIGFGGREARTVMRDWAHQAATGRYEPLGSEVDYETALARSTTPGRIITIEKDSYAPWPAAEHLRRKMGEGTVDHETLAISGVRRAHFDWARKPESLIPRIVDFVRGVVGGR